MRKEIPPKTLEDVEKAVVEWEDAIEWISKGWDCVEEYTNDLCARESLDDTIANCSEVLTPEIESRIAATDQRLRSLTHESEDSVWGASYNNHYDRIRYWYYYRWPHGDI
jgi:hypothetical protein